MCMFACQIPQSMYLLDFINQYPVEVHCKLKWGKM